MRSLVLTFVLLCAAIAMVEAQKINRVRVGEPWPDRELPNMINYPSSTLNPRDYKDKILIIDIWNTGCPACVKQWDELVRLQEKFKDQIQFVLSNHMDSLGAVKKFLERRKRILGVDMLLPISCDPLIQSYSGTVGVPTMVCISQGKVVAIGNLMASVEDIIQKLLKGKPEAARVAMFKEPVVTTLRPFLVDDNQDPHGSWKMRWWSVLYRHNDQLPDTSVLFDKGKESNGLIITNATISDLYRYAYGEVNGGRLAMVPSSKIKMPQVTSHMFFLYAQLDTVRESRFDYQLLPGRILTNQEILKMMQLDLDRYFGFEVTNSRRRLILTSKQ